MRWVSRGLAVRLAQRRRQRGRRGVRRDPGGQRVRVGPVQVAEGYAVEGDLRVVLGGLKLADRLFERRAILVDHPAPPSRSASACRGCWRMLEPGELVHVRPDLSVDARIAV